MCVFRAHISVNKLTQVALSSQHFVLLYKNTLNRSMQLDWRDRTQGARQLTPGSVRLDVSCKRKAGRAGGSAKQATVFCACVCVRAAVYSF